MENIKQKHRFITGFNGLRAIAVIGVILYHLNPTVFSGGYLGVPVFLTLSGYLVTDHLISEYEAGGKFDYRHFWYKRLTKLYPTLIIMLSLSAAYITIVQRNLLPNLWQSVVTNLTYTYNWYEILNGQSYFQTFAGSASPFTHLWTLAIEGQFYLIWPLLVVFLLKLFRNKKGVFYVSIGLSLLSVILMAFLFKPGVDPSRVYYGTDTRMFSILLGSALAVLWPSDKVMLGFGKPQIRFFNIVGTIGAVGMLSLIFLMGAQSNFLYRGGMLLFSFFTILSMWAILANAGSWNRLMTNRVFDWIGSRSYEIYVYQLPVFVFWGDMFKNVADHQFLYAVIELTMIIVMSELSYRYIQVPFAKYDYQTIFAKIWQFIKAIKLKSLVITLIVGIGIFGTIQSTIMNPKQANHTQLANRIKENAKKEKEHNEALAKKIKNKAAVQRSKEDEAALKDSELTKAQLKQATSISGSAIGDSVMLSGRDELQKIFPKVYIDAAVSRQADDSISVLKSLDSKGLLGNNVIIGLGTNGNITDDSVDKMMDIIGNKRHVFWINIHVPTQPWQNQNNELLENAKKKYKNLTVLDWNSFINGHDDWLYSDQTHPNTTGVPKYATFIAKEVLNNAKK